MYFDPKKYTKNSKIRVFQNKEDMISCQKMRKFEKI